MMQNPKNGENRNCENRNCENRKMKGIILAAGRGTRMYPMTRPVCKPLLPVYDKPLIYYSLSLLVQAGCEDVLVIIPPGEERSFGMLLGNGRQWGINISYAVQQKARGIADALLIGADFIGDDRVCLVLGDNIFYAPSLSDQLHQAAAINDGAVVFGYWVEDPRPFGVVEFDAEGRVLSIEEKPQQPKSHYIVPGMYFYDASVVDIARGLQPSSRGELEITDVNLEYLRRGELRVVQLAQDMLWLDAGNADSLLRAANEISRLQHETGRYVGCIEEQVWRSGYIDTGMLFELAGALANTAYGEYLQRLAGEQA